MLIIINMTIPSSVTSLGKSCFAYCSSSSPIIIPAWVTSLSKSCFVYCSFSSSVIIQHQSLKLEGNFQNCFIQDFSLSFQLFLMLKSYWFAVKNNVFYGMQILLFLKDVHLNHFNSFKCSSYIIFFVSIFFACDTWVGNTISKGIRWNTKNHLFRGKSLIEKQNMNFLFNL
jgi:hypothetical protein